MRPGAGGFRLRRWGLKLAERGGKAAKKRAVVPECTYTARATSGGSVLCGRRPLHCLESSSKRTAGRLTIARYSCPSTVVLSHVSASTRWSVVILDSSRSSRPGPRGGLCRLTSSATPPGFTCSRRCGGECHLCLAWSRQPGYHQSLRRGEHPGQRSCTTSVRAPGPRFFAGIPPKSYMARRPGIVTLAGFPVIVMWPNERAPPGNKGLDEATAT